MRLVVLLLTCFCVASFGADYDSEKTYCLRLVIENVLKRSLKAKDIELIKNLVHAGANPNVVAKLEDGWTLIHLAAYENSLDLLNFLADLGVDINLEEDHGNTPLVLAARYGHLQIVKRLIELGAVVNSPTKTLPLNSAIASGKSEIAMFLLEAGALNDDRTLPLAIERRQEDVAILLAPMSKELTSTQKEFYPLKNAISHDLFDLATLLLIEGADPNSGGVNRFSPMSRAVWKNNFDLVILILNAGAKIASDKFKYSYAMKSVEDKRFRHLAKLLYSSSLSSKKRKKLHRKVGLTALNVAMMRRDQKAIIKLLKAGADPYEGRINNLILSSRTEEFLSAIKTKIEGRLVELPPIHDQIRFYAGLVTYVTLYEIATMYHLPNDIVRKIIQMRIDMASQWDENLIKSSTIKP